MLRRLSRMNSILAGAYGIMYAFSPVNSPRTLSQFVDVDVFEEHHVQHRLIVFGNACPFTSVGLLQRHGLGRYSFSGDDAVEGRRLPPSRSR